MNSGDIVVKNQFTNQKTPGAKSVQSFIDKYMLRDQAVEPLVVRSDEQTRYLQMLNELKRPDDQDAVGLLNHKLHYSGVGFNRDQIDLNRNEATTLSRDCQAAFDRGGTVKQMVISFRTDYLLDHDLLDDEIEEPVMDGDLHGHVDQQRLRTAIQDGLSQYFAQSTMHDPQYVGAVQTDTHQLHVHLSIWDQDPAVKDDRGKVNGHQKQAIMDGIDMSLQRQPKYVNTTNLLQTTAEQTQQNARFKKAQLQQELVNSALRLDKASLDEYVKNLALYDQRTLSQRQRETVEQQIKFDWQRQGRRDTQSHTLSQGQRRGRRQIRAMKRAHSLRLELQRFNRADQKQQVGSKARGIYGAMALEYQHQLSIVEKYRMYQRPRVDLIYQNHAVELQTRRQQLLEQRQTLLPQLVSKPLSKTVVNNLLRDVDLMDKLAQPYQGQLNKSPVYQDLKRAQADPKYPLDQHSIHTIVDNVDDSQKQPLETQLMRNQVFDATRLNQQQRLLMLQYQQRLDEYEMDAVSYGGLSTQMMQFSGQDLTQHTLKVPSTTSSIYDRPLGRDNPDLLASDVHAVLDAGPLKPSVEKALRQQLQLRYRRLSNANQYIKNTQQKTPEWLLHANQELNQQFKLLERCEQFKQGSTNDQPKAANNSVDQTKFQDGYVLNQQQSQHLVEKHIDDVADLVQ